MDQVIYQIKKNIYNLTNEIMNATVTDEEFNNMLSDSTFSLNPMSIIIWSILHLMLYFSLSYSVLQYISFIFFNMQPPFRP